MTGMIRLCLAGLKERKGRTMLIAISIAIGVFSVLIISIISENGVTLINAELDSLGISGVSISRPDSEISELFTNEELEQIKQAEYVESATPVITATGHLKDETIESALICGIDENAKSVISVETISGEKISRSDIIGRNKVCLIDAETAETLFQNGFPLGREIDIFLGGSVTRFTVVGIVKESSSILQTSVGDLLPNIIYVPYTTLQKQLGTDRIDQIAVNFTGEYENELCIRRLTALMDGSDLYSAALRVEDLNQQRESLNGILDIVTMIMRLIGGVSLIVSGLGIMTIMLVSVSEKTKEIGIKKSIGAGRGDIVFEFLFESTFISVIGSGIGILLTLLIAAVAYFIFELEIAMNIKTILSTVGIAVLCGMLFGVYPAVKAAKLKPIDALRNE